MKITITYKSSKQVNEDEWATFTEVIHLDAKWTLEQVYEIVAQKLRPAERKDFDVNAEIQFII